MSGFRRTVSLPALAAAAKRSAYKIRSASLPIRFHPIVSRLNDDVASLLSWSSSCIQSPSAPWLSEGADCISIVLTSLFELMQHPLAVDQLRDSLITNDVSEDLLRLVDSYDLFRLALLNLRQLQAGTRASFRRQNQARIASAVHAQRSATHELEQLASTIQEAAKSEPPPPGSESASEDAEGVCSLPLALCSAMAALAAASAMVFVGLTALSDQSTVLPTPLAVGPIRVGECAAKPSWVSGVLQWRSRANMQAAMEEERKARKVALDRFDTLEGCIKDMESRTEELYRGLVRARVFLLNVLSSRL
ncbi:DUF241 domain protein (DUF241) [Rhynchospora pubera]|uniref:DUF241 domain protein (DUF241) n=1 Tax=Rhynchospora pubera TaxID=906938 RepID=A0AAV8DG38_9POAL|nr:DUF241 domain protein (DUF241) [Rhynchospora pubera]